MNEHQNEIRPDSPGVQRVTAAAWAQAFQQQHGREPTMAEYQQALAAGRIAKERDPSVQQLAEGVKQVGQGIKGLYDAKVAPTIERSGAKDFFSEKVAPRAQTALHAAKQTAQQAGGSTGRRHSSRLIGAALPVMPAAAFVGIISLFLPAVSAMGFSASYFNGSDGEGGILLAVFLLVIAASLAAMILRQGWTRVVSAVLGILFGLLGMIDGFGTMASIPSGASVGLGLVLLTLASLVVFAGGAALTYSLWQQRATAKAAAAGLPAPPEPPVP